MHVFDAFKAKSRSHNAIFCDDFNYLVNLQCFYPPQLLLPGRNQVTDYKEELAKRSHFLAEGVTSNGNEQIYKIKLINCDQSVLNCFWAEEQCRSSLPPSCRISSSSNSFIFFFLICNGCHP